MKYLYTLTTVVLLLFFKASLHAQCGANIQYTYNGLSDFTFAVTDKQDTTGAATYLWTLYPDSLVLDSNAQQVQHHFDTNGTYTLCLHVADSVCVFDTCISVAVSNADYHVVLDTINHWGVVLNWCPVTPKDFPGIRSGCNYSSGYYQQYYTTGDTLVDSIQYQKLNSRDGNWIPSPWVTDCLFGFLREEPATRKVYFRDSEGNGEEVLYNFNLNVGDTFVAKSYNYLNFTYDTVKWVVQQKFKYDFKNGPRDVLALHNTALNFTMVWVEGVGCINHPFYIYIGNWWWGGCAPIYCTDPNDPLKTLLNYNANLFLSCFAHQEYVYFDSCAYQQASAYPGGCYQAFDSCSYGWVCGDVKNIPSLTSLTITPNPASEQAEVILDVNEGNDFSLSVLNANGAVLLSNFYSGHLNEGLHKKTLRLQNLPAGIYLVECRSGKSSTYRKLIVAH